MPIHHGQIIAHLRGRTTQKEIAAKLNMKQQQYARIEKRKKIEDFLLERIASIIGCSLNDIKNYGLTETSDVSNAIVQEDISTIKKRCENLLEEKEKIIQILLETIRSKDLIIENFMKEHK
jgi:transcriptional regulator with XRE-family HTH domain